MRSFIFLCDMTTEQECLDRMLFGANAGENHQHHYKHIAVGDRLFLYNFELGLMRGPYPALTTCTYNLEPTAWKKTRRAFPWQVRVDGGAANAKPIRIDAITLGVDTTILTNIISLKPRKFNRQQL